MREEAEEDMPRWPNHNSNMPVPHHQIRGLRTPDALESFDPVIQIVGTRVGVGKSGPLVNRMHQVRAVVLGNARRLRIKGRGNHRQPIVGIQRPLPLPRRRLRILPAGVRRSRSRRVLRARHTKSQPAEQHRNRGRAPIPHRPILMPVPPSAEITFVHAIAVHGTGCLHGGTVAKGSIASCAVTYTSNKAHVDIDAIVPDDVGSDLVIPTSMKAAPLVV